MSKKETHYDFSDLNKKDDPDCEYEYTSIVIADPVLLDDFKKKYDKIKKEFSELTEKEVWLKICKEFVNKPQKHKL